MDGLNFDSQKYSICSFQREKGKAYEKMVIPVPGDRYWCQNRLINIIPEVDDDGHFT
jgi:hypothetical protein